MVVAPSPKRPMLVRIQPLLHKDLSATIFIKYQTVNLTRFTNRSCICPNNRIGIGIWLRTRVLEVQILFRVLPIISKSFPVGVVMESLSLWLMVQILPAIKQQGFRTVEAYQQNAQRVYALVTEWNRYPAQNRSFVGSTPTQGTCAQYLRLSTISKNPFALGIYCTTKEVYGLVV